MVLSTLDFINGIFGTLLVGLSIILGLIIVSKYFKNQNRNFIYVGLAWCLFVSGWYGTTASFYVALFTGGEGLSFGTIMALNFLLLPLALILWLLAFTNFLYKEKRKLIMAITTLISLGFYVIFLYFLITDPSYIGHKISPVDTSGNLTVLIIYLFFMIVILFVTVIKFGIETIKIGDPETKLKGKLLILAAPTFCIGAILDATIPTDAITLVIFRSILILSAIEFYGGFILPGWMKRLFLRSVNALGQKPGE